MQLDQPGQLDPQPGKPGVPRKRDFFVFKCLIFWCLIFSNWALRGNPGLPCTKHELCLKKTWFASENLQLFHSTQAKNTTRYLEKGNLAPAEGRPHWLQPMGGVSRSKYLESVLQRYKEVIGLLAKAFCQDFSGIP